MEVATDPNAADQYLTKGHGEVSILALRMSCRRLLALHLDQDAAPMPSGLSPNFEGLAECLGFGYLETADFQRDKRPTLAVLAEWGNRPDLDPTVGRLVNCLLKLGRLDVLEDCKDKIKADVENYLEKKMFASSEGCPVQDATVSQSPFNIDDMKVDETIIMTVQDVEAGGPTYYDAFVCYHPNGADLRFVREMIARLECPPHNLRLFVPHRDDLPGASKHVISAKLIQERCKRMVIVMSPRYLQSDACDFQTKFAHALSPGSRSKKLVPVMVTWCDKPNILRHVTMCDYTRGDLAGWFWDRLTRSLQAPLNPGEIDVVSPDSFSQLEMNISDKNPALSLKAPNPSSPPTSYSPSASSLQSSPTVSSKFPPVSKSSPVCERTSQPTSERSPSPSMERSSSPSTELKSGGKKRDLKSKFKSVFSSYTSTSHT